ncbi:hypothetical protein MXB_3 [Myxobolus squamalis]|nr:hypothetical protein MXB_3 [Myxobolus squamalis]
MGSYAINPTWNKYNVNKILFAVIVY